MRTYKRIATGIVLQLRLSRTNKRFAAAPVVNVHKHKYININTGRPIDVYGHFYKALLKLSIILRE